MNSTIQELLNEYRHSGTDCVNWEHHYKKWILTVECEADMIYARLSHLGIEIPISIIRTNCFQTDKQLLINTIADYNVIQELSHALAALF